MIDKDKAVPVPTPIDSDTTSNNHEKRIERFSNAKLHQAPIVDYLCTQGKPHAKAVLRLQQCGTYLLFRDYFTVGETRLVSTRTCQQRFICLPCEIRRGTNYVASYVPKFEQLIAENPKLKPLFITFTVKNRHDLLSSHRHLKNSFTKLTTRAANYKKRGGLYSEWCKVAGFVGSEEFTHNPDHGWHPHFHFVVLAESELDQARLRTEWEGITKDSFIVDVRPFNPSDDVVKSFCEVFKYALKPSGLTPEQIVLSAKHLKGQRLIRSGGIFRGVVVVQNACDQIHDLTGLPYRELVYRWIDGDYKLTKTREYAP